MSQIYKDHIATMLDPPHYVTFNRWNTIGSKFIALAAGGSFYILVLIAGLDMRYKIATIGSRIPWEVAKMLRSPETSSMYVIFSISSLLLHCACRHAFLDP
jgi:hypothetical protein